MKTLSSFDEPIYIRLKRIRCDQNISVKKMAQLIGVPLSTYREWEKGRGIKSLPPFVKISQVLAISVTELMTGDTPNLKWVSDDLQAIEIQARNLKLKLNNFI